MSGNASRADVKHEIDRRWKTEKKTFLPGQLNESLIKLYFKQFSIFQLFSWIKVKVLISFA
jgi:hypothetical protein